MTTVSVDVTGSIATITLNRPKSLNAIKAADYEAFATSLREIDKMEGVLVTVWQATGSWFCAGTDVSTAFSQQGSREGPAKNDDGVRQMFLGRVAATTTDCSQALYSHSKILVAALNGPVLGIAAALLGHFDFIYCMPNAWLAVPFSFLGIVAEGGSSATFIQRMGISKANEVLLWGKKQTAEDLLGCGFVNKIFPTQPTEEFHSTIRQHLEAELEGLDPSALFVIKKLIRGALNDMNDPDAINMRESYAQAGRFASGIPTERFLKIATRQIRHKL